jgi:hypothetical protein
VRPNLSSTHTNSKKKKNLKETTNPGKTGLREKNEKRIENDSLKTDSRKKNKKRKKKNSGKKIQRGGILQISMADHLT